MRVLLVKMSSLGDVVHALPALTDAARHGIRFSWVVEEAFAAIPPQHPAVERVLPIAWRRWRKSPVADFGELRDFLRTLRSETYDVALDAQGLIKSAVVTSATRAAVKAGFDFAAAREGAAALAYGRRLAVTRDAHAVDRLRTLFAGALGYPLPDTEAVFGLVGAGSTERNRCLLLHGTTWASKHWPDRMWQHLAARLAELGWQVEIPWSDALERQRAERMAAGQPGIVVLDRLPLDALAARIARAGLVVGVDSGLSHLAGAYGVPTLVIYGSTSAARTGCRGARVVNLQADFGCAPCLSRDCGYAGPDQRWRGEVVNPACYARVTPERVLEEAMALLER